MKQRQVPAPTVLAGLLRLAFGAMALGATGAALAQAEESKLQRVEITGSSIKRLDAETALPVQVIRREDIDKSGVTTAAELLGKVSASAAGLTDGASFSDISGQRGFNGANLRGIGVSSTLVLLNGRRLANFASPGSNAGVDLNAIPAAAIARVEVLKDGASAIYGTDAIGGVINFITRSDYVGADASIYGSATQHGGAGKTMATLSGGTGKLSEQGYNAFMVLDYQDNKPLRSGQRDWIGSAYQPDINLDVGSSNTFPANVRRVRANGSPTGPRLNPSAPACNPPATVYAPGSFVGSQACLYDYMQDTEIFPESKRLSLLARGEFEAGGGHTVFAEALHNVTRSTYRISPLTVTNLNYPLAGEYYPHSLITTNKTDLRVSMRLAEGGNRTNEVESTAQRLLLGAKGTLAGWDYNTGLNHSVNTVDDQYIDGYVRTSAFDSAFATGKINPFGASGAEGQALLKAAKINDAARQSRGTTNVFDAKATRDLFEMAGGTAAIAVGGEYRKEKMRFTPSALLAAGEIRGDGAAAAFAGQRTVKAAYVELNLPFLAGVETQLALRHDRYDDFGATTNPKFGLRWQPAKEFVARASYGEGFRAPSLSDLYNPPRTGQTNGIYNDPLGCIKTAAIDNTGNPDYCGLQPDKLLGGRAGLKPETSKQFSAGVVFEPQRNLTATLDYWKIRKQDVIVAPEGSYFSDPVRNAAYIERGAADPSLPGIPGPILSIDSRLRNIGSLETSGLDLGVNWRSAASAWGRVAVGLTGTYVLDYKTREADAPELNGAGVFANDQVVQRWRHTLSLDYDLGPWSATLQQTFYSHYRDQNPNPDGSERRVKAYQLWDLTGSYAWSKALRLRGGIRNLLDTNPPRSNQIYSFLAGYDPNYTDSRGRSFFLSANYSFR
ncbi:TonB-dependent receptor [Pseudoduganella sp. DS3]|uniref:TonB-dependent receptor n=1 Tax=Pseudoduganella guangdongensis TaxID=2692179 RepID=A0A6N9HKE8_9BURK|nr:TonB-dependent receptor [Pseudoduganella guangdongensis]MYN03643.1 TonB-dependent receptor [Pseudoduganella guangdongensis]